MSRQAICTLLVLVQIGFAQVWQGLRIDSVPIWHDSLRTDTSANILLDVKDSSHLETSGYKAVHLVVGNEGTEVRQEMRLGIQGEAAPGWFVDARLVDEGMHPGEQRVSTLQEMDEMMLKIMHGRSQITLGDFRYQQDSLTLFDTHHSSMGAMAEWNGDHIHGQWAGGQDPMRRHAVVLAGHDGQRTGYLIAQGGAGFVSVVPNSENVWFNGKKLTANVDYHLENSGGVLDFIGSIMPSNNDQIRVDYEEYGNSFSRTFLASDASVRWGAWQLMVGTSGLWTDLAEVRRLLADSLANDTLLLTSHPQDQRLAGALLSYQGKFLKASIEAAASKYDSNTISPQAKSLQGRAGRWTLSSAGDWSHIRSGFQGEYMGAWLDSSFYVGEQTGRVRDWDAWDLHEHWELDSLDSLHVDRHYEWSRMGWGFGNAWRPWVGGGIRTVGADGKSERVVAGLDQSSPDLQSLFDIAGVEAHEQGTRKRLQAEMSSQILKGLLRPFGNAQSYWRSSITDTISNEWLDTKAESGLQYGRTGLGWSGQIDGAVEHMQLDRMQGLGWQDSLRSVSSANQMEIGNTHAGINSLLQWKRTWDGSSPNHSDNWVSEQRGHWDYLEDQGSITHKLGLTREHPLVAAYKAVAAGTGDVLYDSLTRQFVEGVDKGDFVRNGWSRADSLPLVEESEVGLALENWWAPGPALHINHGLLRDIRIGFKGDWHMRDTTRVVLVPPFFWNDMLTAVEGASRDELLLDWTQAQGIADMQWSFGAEKQRTWSIEAVDNRQWWQRVDGSLRWADVWRLRFRGGHEIHDYATSGTMHWTANEAGGGLRRDLPHNWNIEGALRMRVNTGDATWGALNATLWQPAFTATWHFDKTGEFTSGYTLSYLQTHVDQLPYQITEGFATGMTHRVETRLAWTIKERVQMSVSHILRVEPNSAPLFQKFTGEAKAFF